MGLLVIIGGVNGHGVTVGFIYDAFQLGLALRVSKVLATCGAVVVLDCTSLGTSRTNCLVVSHSVTVGFALSPTAVCTNLSLGAGCIAILVGHSCIDIFRCDLCQLSGMGLVGASVLVPYLVDLNAVYHFSTVVRAGCDNRRAIITCHAGVFAYRTIVDHNSVHIAGIIQIFYIAAVHVEITVVAAGAINCYICIFNEFLFAGNCGFFNLAAVHIYGNTAHRAEVTGIA